MFSSILQMMGFPATKPLHSRAKENTAARTAGSSAAAAGVPSKARASASTPQEQSPRRSTVKSASKSSKKVTAKAAPVAKAVKAAQPAKAVKPVQKAQALKVASNKTVKVQPQPKRPAVTSAAKKVASEVAVKKTAPASVKAAAKSAPKAKPLPSKTPSRQPAVAVKSAAPVARAPSSPTQQNSKPVTRVVEAKPIVSNPVKTDKKVLTPATPAPVTKVAVTATESDTSSLAMPVRSGRPSARLAQLTVPSMAQSVASNAAKSSFSQMTPVKQVASPTVVHVKKNPKLANNWKSKAVAELSDEEVIAMPDQEYMNDTQMAFFRLKLVNLKDAILNNAGETTEHLREDTVVVPDPADRATIEEEHALELRTRDRERKLLKKIEQSINRIDAGDYGYCDETGEPIGVARLLARPTATLSLEAQQRRELKQKMFGD